MGGKDSTMNKMSYFNLLMPAGNRKVTHTKTNLQLS